jgi:hypothetical protein
MKHKLPALLITLFLILTLVPAAFAQDVPEEEVVEPIGKATNFFCTYLAELPDPEDPADPADPLETAEDGDPVEPVESVVPLHPVATGIVTTYAATGVTYDQVMTWFCVDGFGFGEIMLALETSKFLGEDDGMTPEEILLQKDELGGWGAVWSIIRTEADINGRPKSDDWTGGWPDRKHDGTTDESGGVGPSNLDSPKKQGVEDPVSDDPQVEPAKTNSSKATGTKHK